MAPIKSRLQEEHPFPGSTVPKYRTRFYSVHEMNGWAAALVGSGAGAPIIGEATTSSLTGLRIQADADSFVGFIALPDDCDVNAPIDMRLLWSSDQTTTADEYTWTATYTEMLINSTSDMDAAGATALDTPWVADANLATADALQALEWGTIAGGTLTGTQGDGYFLNLNLVATTNGGTVATDLVIWWGLQIRYMPKTL